MDTDAFFIMSDRQTVHTTVCLAGKLNGPVKDVMKTDGTFQILH